MCRLWIRSTGSHGSRPIILNIQLLGGETCFRRSLLVRTLEVVSQGEPVVKWLQMGQDKRLRSSLRGANKLQEASSLATTTPALKVSPRTQRLRKSDKFCKGYGLPLQRRLHLSGTACCVCLWIESEKDIPFGLPQTVFLCQKHIQIAWDNGKVDRFPVTCSTVLLSGPRLRFAIRHSDVQVPLEFGLSCGVCSPLISISGQVFPDIQSWIVDVPSNTCPVSQWRLLVTLKLLHSSAFAWTCHHCIRALSP